MHLRLFASKYSGRRSRWRSTAIRSPASFTAAGPNRTTDSSATKKWSNPNIPRSPYNPAQARELLSAIGLQDRNGDALLEDAAGHAVEIPFLTNLGNPARLTTARLIAEDLAKVGIKLDLQPIPFAELSEKTNANLDYECVLLGLSGGGVDPAASLNALGSASPACQRFPGQPSPSTGWEARIDALMRAQMQRSIWPNARKLSTKS